MMKLINRINDCNFNTLSTASHRGFASNEDERSVVHFVTS